MRGKKETKKKHEFEISQEELEGLLKKATERDEYHERYLKILAEYDNTRKRLEKEKSDHMIFANESLIATLFPIVDNFDMALSAMETAKDKESVMEGIKLVQKEFHRVLDESGVARIKTEGKMFDPNFHEAVMVEETDEVPDGQILEEVRAGYTLNGRLLRPAQVKVAKNDSEDDKMVIGD